jgi:hypothetical protein
MTKPTPFWKRLAWMVGLWVMGVATLAVVAGIIKWWLQ